MPAIILRVLFHGLPEDAPKEGVPFQPYENPLIVPAENGRIYVLGMSIVPTKEEKEAIARAIEEQQKAQGNDVKVIVDDVKTEPKVKPETGEVGVAQSIQLRVIDPKKEKAE